MTRSSRPVPRAGPRALLPPPPLLLLLPLLLTLALRPAPAAAGSLSPAAGDYDCAAFDPRQSQPDANGCLARLQQTPQDYEPCRDPSLNTTCYIFLQEPPFVTLNNLAPWSSSAEATATLQAPFRCGDYASVFRHVGGIGGIAMRIHNLTSSSDDLCMWGGHSDHCAFNQLVDFVSLHAADGYRFAVTGLLLELPSRQCRHHPSAPLIDDTMIIIGKRAVGAVSNGPLHQLSRPFHWGAWAILAAVILLFAAVCIAIAVRFRVFRGRSLVTAFFIFTGERQDAMAHERNTHNGDASHAVSFATKYGLAMNLYRIALLAFLGIFVLFYEVAVVNFLFQQQSVALAKSVKSLSSRELGDYSVLKGSALESVWNATVRMGRGGDDIDGDSIPWQRCATATDCIRDAITDDTQFVVTFEIVGKYLLLQESVCDDLAIFETKDILYQFNGGWLYNNATNEEKRKIVDREIVSLRIDGTTRSLIDEEISDYSCESAIKPDIGPMIILIPCMIFVVPPLLLSVFIMVCWKKKTVNMRRQGDGAEGQKLGKTQVRAVAPASYETGHGSSSWSDSQREDDGVV